jgi:4-alpha-glucanotransferase
MWANWLAMDIVDERVARWGIETQYRDGLGHNRVVAPEVLARLVEIFSASGEPGAPQAPPTGDVQPAYQCGDTAPERMWGLAVQLYGVRSRRNWGHGDFTDLENLIELAAGLGASGIGLNPLHALFDNLADAYSPYSPNSRLFLNSHYIDPERIAEYPGSQAAGLADKVAALRRTELVDYAGVIEAKTRAFTLCYRTFRNNGTSLRKQDFTSFRERGGDTLVRFSCFEFLRRKFAGPWWTWPDEWRTPDDGRLAALRISQDEAIGLYEFLQWAADSQLRACRERAATLGLPIGLYLDIAVGVRADGFDAWNEQDVFDRALDIGAPPDRLNLEGQRWGLAGINPVALEGHECRPFAHMLRASMQYAGAIRLDHVLGLNRLYLIPKEMRADQGAYVRLPFESLLKAVSQESRANRCVVIGEDLGTVPDGFRETLAEWGTWSYQVMMFQRAADGGFIAPDHYSRNALVTFATHDLPTFAGWMSGQDLSVKRALGMDPGETEEDRTAAREALGAAMRWRGLDQLDYRSVTKFLAETPSRFLVVSAEDALGLVDQVNVPGTIAEHPNWRRRLPIDLEDLKAVPLLASLAEILSTVGRRI